ncbi:hypothetical protein C7H19_07970 [Aphanothece hegewaldii CCALA 016]|uniref:Methyltransferase domain-containing protein n=1 Tax=Aphanothece hegewaldii CCALA 016 TaxID=2107694 RepID=A0A2T1LZR9_9CHRO|nr:class I SAM-dependent methyltransferase [Aphanothece hegewaldii]PSF37906.1 hypothetical protein C7H19_07970 [Aphanothece hegewaldii CCALA 016]
MSKLLTNQKIAFLAWNLYKDAPITTRLLASARTYICPMQPLLGEVPKHSTVLDIGCGSGLFLFLLIANEQVTKAVGIDANAKMLNSTKLTAHQLAQKRLGIDINFIEADNPNDWPNNNFSVVSMIDVIHHIPPEKQQAVFEEATQRVCPGGYLLYKDMCKQPFWRATANRLHDLILARQWIHYCPIDKIKQWGSACGLTLEKESYYSKWVYGHEKLVFKKPE